MGHSSFSLVCTPASFRGRTSNGAGVDLVRARPDEAARCARLWREVGAGFWTERADWDDARWARRLRRPAVSFWIARVSGADAGCFELTRASCGARIEGFGLLAAFRGRGLGRDLLTAATQRAFTDNAPRVWLHTATDDHPAALPNYVAGGYRVVRERELRDPMPRSELPAPDDRVRELGRWA